MFEAPPLDTRWYHSEKAISPSDGAAMWVVIDRNYELHKESSEYLAALRTQEDASVNTERTYAGRIALYLSYCHDHGVNWSSPSMRQLAAFLHWLVETPLPSRRRIAPTEPATRSKGTANAILTSVCQFIRFCTLMGYSPPELRSLLSEPKQLRFLPVGFDPGEEGQHTTVNARRIKFKVAVPGYEYLTDDEIHQILSRTTHARDRFLISLMVVSGIRIGEALGLRREDMHLLASAKMLGCSVAGPHIHIRRRQNTNGALSKSRHPRTIPVGEEIGGLYAQYQWERERVAEAAASDMVFVNLFASPLGQPMKYPSTYELFQRLARRAGFPAHPHMLRHSALTRWVRNGTSRYVIQDLAGHASPHSQDRYHHASDREKREAVKRVTMSRGASK